MNAPARPSPYAGLHVVELADDTAGEIVGQLLAGMGADVVKVEPPEGAPGRRLGPFVGDQPHPDRSLHFWSYNRGKRSVVLDIGAADGRHGLDTLLGDADVVITSAPPARAAAEAIEPAALAAAHPALVVLSVTPFGLDGPWADHVSCDLVSLAAGGPLMSCGYDDHSIPPIRPGGDQAAQTAAAFGHIGLLLALIERQRTGRGQVVDVSMHESLAVSVELANPYWFYPRVLVQRQTCRHAQPVPTQPALFQCLDGRYVYFALILADQKPWRALVSWLDELGMAGDLVEPAFDALAHRQAHFSHIQGIVEAFFMIQDAETVYHDGQARGLPIGILNAPEDLLHDEHLAARNFFVDVATDDPDAPPRVTMPGAPFRFSSFEPPDPGRAPRLGEHTAEVLSATVAPS